jgi:hypothetical protein
MNGPLVTLIPGIALIDGVKRSAGFLCSVCAGKFEQRLTLDGNFVLTGNFRFPDETRRANRFFCGPQADQGPILQSRISAENFFG